MRLVWIPLSMLSLCAAACVAPTDPKPGEGDADGDGAPVAAVELPFDDGSVCEDVDEAQCALSACSVACYGAAALGCGGVLAACVGGNGVTVGTLTVPCFLALAAACGAFGGSALENCGQLCGGA